MTPFTAVFQYHRFVGSPESGDIGGVDCTTLGQIIQTFIRDLSPVGVLRDPQQFPASFLCTFI